LFDFLCGKNRVFGIQTSLGGEGLKGKAEKIMLFQREEFLSLVKLTKPEVWHYRSGMQAGLSL
jgi:hypothetical protein